MSGTAAQRPFASRRALVVMAVYIVLFSVLGITGINGVATGGGYFESIGAWMLGVFPLSMLLTMAITTLDVDSPFAIYLLIVGLTAASAAFWLLIAYLTRPSRRRMTARSITTSEDL